MKIKRDRYRKNRGGTSQIYQINCSNCNNSLLKYQKDGIGTLIRLYVDRIVEPKMNGDSNLICPSCGVLIAISMIYKTEDRSAYRLLRGSFTKTKVKL